MPGSNYKTMNDLYTGLKIARVDQVYPQTKKMDLSYISMPGQLKDVMIPFSSAGLTNGSATMPNKGDKVILGFVEGARPVAIAFYPPEENLYPYTHPGEVGQTSTSGSFIHIKIPRKRSKTTGELLSDEATTDSQGGTNFEWEPGGINLQVKSPKDPLGNAPRNYTHSYISLFDNGNVAIQSAYQGVNKGLLHFDQSGHVWLQSGNGQPQEYIELDPLSKTLLLFSDGEQHKFAQTHNKEIIYGNSIFQSGGAIDIKLGLPLDQITGNFNNVSTTLNPGDISIDNTASSSGITRLSLKGNFTLNVSEGNISFNAAEGNVSVAAPNGSITMSAKSGIFTSGGAGQGNDAVITKSFFDGHRHFGSNIPNQTAEPIVPAPDTKFYA